ncbi:HK97 family phage prohead protease [Priestia aryabhattai]|nr:HK97 family phage prohead protease [Priestia aryabhattai]MED4261974.1 HK97 family phage prohead protease [Priestia aryabhattai]
MNMELRVQNSSLQANEDGSMTVSGYVNRTEQLSNTLGVTKRFKEKISKGVFTRAIQNAQRDIDFLAEHNNKLILASTRNNSLELREDDEGLYMSATIAPTSWGKDYYELISSGILQNMSFGFRTIKDSWKPMEQGIFERTIEDLELIEVSVVRDPAYSQSTISARGIDLVEDVEIPAELEEEIRNMDELKQMLTSLGEQVTSLTEEVRELRSATEAKVEEVREEPVEEIVATEVQEEVAPETEEVVVEETPVEEPQEEVIEEEVSDEKSEDYEKEEQETEADEKEEVAEEVVEEQERSNPEAELAELRSILAELKK